MCDADLPADRVPSGIIRIAAAVIQDQTGYHLLVRKKGTTSFMQAGGKLGPGEAPRDALKRELAEELGLQIGPDEVRYLGLYVAPAAHEPGYTVIAYVYEVAIAGLIAPAAEIEELLWLNPLQEPQPPLAPLTKMILSHENRVGAEL
jgi:8-oxo-dGTP diphosphatase